MALLSAAAGVVAVALLVPISVRANGAAGEDELWGRVEVRWGHIIAMFRLGPEAVARLHLFGIPLVRMENLFKRSAEKRKQKEERRAAKKLDEQGKRQKGRKWRRPSVWQLLTDQRRVVVGMMGRGLRALHPQLYVGGTIGLADPASTAWMLTAVHQIDRLISDRVELDIRDDFLEETTQLVGRVRVWVLPAEVVLVLLVWLLRSDTRRILLRGK